MQDAGEEVRQAADENAQWHQRARQYVQAVTALHQDLTALGNHALLHQKLTGSENDLPSGHCQKPGAPPAAFPTDSFPPSPPPVM